MTDGDAVCRLFHGALQLLQMVVLACCASSEEFGQLRPDASAALEALELSATCTDLLHRLGAVGIVSDLLCDDFPVTVRLAAARLLFVMLLRDGGGAARAADSHVRDVLSSPGPFGLLLAALTSTEAYTATAATHASVGNATKDAPPAQETWSSHNTTFTEVEAAAATLPELCLSLRLHLAACLRELANTHYARLAGDEVFDVLLRIGETDSSGDLRALCIETMHVVLRHCTPAQWASLGLRKELTALCSTQLRREGHHDALCATLCLLETLILTDAGDSAVDDASCLDARGDECDDASVCELLLALFADRALAALIGDATASAAAPSGGSRKTKAPSGRSHAGESQPRQLEQSYRPLQERQQSRAGGPSAAEAFVAGTTVACLSARCLRLLVQHAPYYRNAAFFLVQHLPSSSRLLKTSVRLATFVGAGHGGDDALHGAGRGRGSDTPTGREGGGVDEAALMLAVELAILVGLCLAQDPRARQLLAAEFCHHHLEAQQTRSALISNLNLVSLSYFAAQGGGGVSAIVDVTGRRLNTLGAVAWDTPDRPSRAAVHSLFTAQESRWNRGELQRVSPAPASRAQDAAGVAEAGAGSADAADDLSREAEAARWRGEEEEEEGVLPASLAASERQRLQRLTFIVLSYAIHYTFKFATEDAAAATQFAAALRCTADDDGLREALAPVAGKAPRYYETYMLDASGGATREEAAGPQPPMAKSFLFPSRRDRPLRGRGRHVSPAGANGAGSVGECVRDVPDGPAAELTAEEARLFLRFHRGLRLFCDLAQFYTPHPTSLLSRTAVYQATAEKGMVRRQGRREAQRTIAKILQEAQDAAVPPPRLQPQSAPQPQRRRQQQVSSLGLLGVNTRAWSINELQEEDLFYFYIPYPQLTREALQYTRRRAVTHGKRLKRVFAVTPQAAKARRWLLHDAIANIMPGVVHALSQFIQWFDAYGADAVKLPLLIYFDDDEVRGAGGGGGGGGGEGRTTPSPPAPLPRADEVALHAGNLIPLLQPIAFYLQRQGQWLTPEDRDAQSREGSASVTAVTQGGTPDTARASYASPSTSVLQGDARGTVTPVRGATTAAAPASTARKSVLMRDIERQIERLQKLDVRDVEGDPEVAGDSLLPDIAASPYGGGWAPHTAEVMGGLGRHDEDEDDEDDEDEDEADDFDELTAVTQVNHAWATQPR
ncbi:casein kinase II, alpha chain [Trypanosoma conorhini]|uniref:Casein kinase II, alpha chain n=1 Tax=Trypanosoma conorhini TaxID=83891 RepID=A0A3R7MKG9_9TRYP|nr:casein kinase II, alpha chain [Trypanosoma conorhini]RNF16622.1 casein kinase II, alpha chain [Trypanosoma conorhini]